MPDGSLHPPFPEPKRFEDDRSGRLHRRRVRSTSTTALGGPGMPPVVEAAGPANKMERTRGRSDRREVDVKQSDEEIQTEARMKHRSHELVFFGTLKTEVTASSPLRRHSQSRISHPRSLRSSDLESGWCWVLPAMAAIWSRFVLPCASR